ncbi:exonuclease 3'-5' domain-containing protein 2-like isoform 1-T1 [Glossina fuscipes fuscipes]
MSKIVVRVGIGLGLAYLFVKFQNYLEPCDHDKACDNIVNTLRKHCGDYKVLGFDCEWVSVGRSRKPVALLQLASSNGFCGLFHLCHMHHIPKSLKNLLEDKEIIKVGIDPSGDAQKLQEDYGIYVASTFDIRYLAVMIGCKPLGLEKLSRLVLNVDLIKPWHISASNWEDKKLSDAQIEYAANAFAGIDIFKHLSYRLKRSNELFFRNVDFARIKSEIEDLVGYRKCCRISKFIENFVQKKSVRYSPASLLPGNDPCRLQAPNGELLCGLSSSKAEWYLEEGLGAKALSKPFTVRLNKEPACKELGYQAPHLNECAICSGRDAFVLRTIVPMEYRKHFPVLTQFYSCDDVKLVCVKCDRLSHISDVQIHHALSLMCNAPRGYEQVIKQMLKENEFDKIKSCHDCKASKNYEMFLKVYSKDSRSGKEMLSRARGSDHGAKVVKKFQTVYGGLRELEMLWGNHFSAKRTSYPEYVDNELQEWKYVPAVVEICWQLTQKRREIRVF